MRLIDYTEIIREAWAAFGSLAKIRNIIDVSVHVSTNYVYRIKLDNKKTIYAKLSYFGEYKLFNEDHQIINSLARTLPAPYEKFLAKSLVKNGKVFTYQYRRSSIHVWVVFYNSVRKGKNLPKRLNKVLISKMGHELGKFHLTCSKIAPFLPTSTKSLTSDISYLQDYLQTEEGRFEHRNHLTQINEQCRILSHNLRLYEFEKLEKIPVFIDWNIGNFSLTKSHEFFSRWDYDWFRLSTRVLDFYFFSRVVSDIGDKTVFSYCIDTLMEDRFLIFLKAYHKVYPLTKKEIYLMRETFRFFILNYVVKDGNYFFHSSYANRLIEEAFELYFPSIETKFDPDKILHALKI